MSKKKESFDNNTILDPNKMTKKEIVDLYRTLRADYLKLISYSKRQNNMIIAYKMVFKSLTEEGIMEFYDIEEDEQEESELELPTNDTMVYYQ